MARCGLVLNVFSIIAVTAVAYGAVIAVLGTRVGRRARLGEARLGGGGASASPSKLGAEAGRIAWRPPHRGVYGGPSAAAANACSALGVTSTRRPEASIRCHSMVPKR